MKKLINPSCEQLVARRPKTEDGSSLTRKKGTSVFRLRSSDFQSLFILSIPKLESIIYLKLLALILTVFACSKDELKPVIKDTYEATVFIYHSNTIVANNTIEQYDTFRFDIKIDTSLNVFQEKECTGEMRIEFEKISFQSNECACWCDCDPRIDCGGNIMLGEYGLVRSGDTLFLSYEYEYIDSVSFNNYVLSYSSTRNISLVKK